MTGDDRVRFCQQCRRQVYNLSAMSHAQATDFVQKIAGRTCLRFFRRADGTVMTQDCPVGRTLFESPPAGVTGLILFAFLACFAFLVWFWYGTRTRDTNSGGRILAGPPRQTEPMTTILEWLDPAPVEWTGY
jgi:hypothetical protein